MKIAYLIRHDITLNDGVTKKILGQISEWENNGNEVQVYAYVPKIGDSILPAKQFVMDGAIKSRLNADQKFLEDITLYDPDMIYLRYDTWSRTVGILQSYYPVIAELNTLDLSEFYSLIKLERSLKSILRYFAYKLFRGLVLRKVSGIVSVTNEIMNDVSNKKYHKPSIAIPNGIDLNIYKTLKKPAESNNRTGLFFIGTPGQPWHGVDYIEQIASKMKNLDFHIVGFEGDNTDNVFYYGYLTTEKYKAVLEKCSICIGTLGLHRKNMFEACPLKVREYLAYGYPVILGYQDTAFINSGSLPSFIYTLDTTKEISVENIINLQQFINKNANAIVMPSDILFIDTKFIENTRVGFFKDVIGK